MGIVIIKRIEKVEQMKTIQYKYILRDSGDWSVGILPWEAQITLSVEEDEKDDDFEICIREAIAGYYNFECLTEKQVEDEIKYWDSLKEDEV